MRPRLQLAVLLLVAVLIGCGTLSNKRLRLSDLRSAWVRTTYDVLIADSGTSVAAREDLLDGIAMGYTQGDFGVPCEKLEVIAVRQLVLRSVVVPNPRTRERVTYRPDTFLETWTVRACDATHLWTVLDPQGQTFAYR